MVSKTISIRGRRIVRCIAGVQNERLPVALSVMVWSVWSERHWGFFPGNVASGYKYRPGFSAAGSDVVIVADSKGHTRLLCLVTRGQPALCIKMGAGGGYDRASAVAA